MPKFKHLERPDFTKRMAATREIFEECNILIGSQNNLTLSPIKTELRDLYLKSY
jgi:hypothetical protein